MFKFTGLKDLEKKKMDALLEMLLHMQKMRANRIVATWRRLQELSEAIAAADTTLQERLRERRRVEWQEWSILDELASDEQLASWVQDLKGCPNPLLKRALERAMRRALGEKRREWEWEKWEGQRERECRWAEEQQQPGQKRKGEWDVKLRDRQWEQEWVLRERKQQILDRVDLRELELQLSQLRKEEARLDRGADGLGEGEKAESQDVTQERERLENERKELDSALYWSKRDLNLDLKAEALDSLKAWHHLVNRRTSLDSEEMAAKDGQEREKLLAMKCEFRRLENSVERLQKDQAFDEISLQMMASFDWQRLNRLVERSLSWYPAEDRLPLVEWQIFRCRWHYNLFNIICGNRYAFTAQKENLEFLLVFAAVFSCIIVAFFIGVGPNAQERGILFQILQALQSITSQPFQPTPALSIWAWSFMTSLTGAAVVALTTLRGWWTIDEEEAQAIFSTPEGLQRRLKEIRRSIFHLTFQYELSFLAGTASRLFYLAFALFFAGFGALFIQTIG